jgi:hypothetical protein
MKTSKVLRSGAVAGNKQRLVHAGLVELRVHGKSVPTGALHRRHELVAGDGLKNSLPVAAHVAVDVIALVPARATGLVGDTRGWSVRLLCAHCNTTQCIS